MHVPLSHSPSLSASLLLFPCDCHANKNRFVMHFLPLTWPDLRRICEIEDEVQVPVNCGASNGLGCDGMGWDGMVGTSNLHHTTHNNVTRTGAKGTSLKNVNVNWKLCPQRCVLHCLAVGFWSCACLVNIIQQLIEWSQQLRVVYKRGKGEALVALLLKRHKILLSRWPVIRFVGNFCCACFKIKCLICTAYANGRSSSRSQPLPVAQTAKINLLLLNVVVAVAVAVVVVGLSQEVLSALGIFSAALKVQRNLIKCSSHCHGKSLTCTAAVLLHSSPIGATSFGHTMENLLFALRQAAGSIFGCLVPQAELSSEAQLNKLDKFA